MPQSDQTYHLRDLIRNEAMSALANNAYSVLLTVLYVKVGLEIASYCCWIRKRQLPQQYHVSQTPRILVHLCLSSTILFWPLYDPTDWSWRLNALVPSAVATRLVYKVSWKNTTAFSRMTLVESLRYAFNATHHSMYLLSLLTNAHTKPHIPGHRIEGLRRRGRAHYESLRFSR
jgi:hypothetical protein